MKSQPSQHGNQITERLILIPYTIAICNAILDADFSWLNKLNLKKGLSWPDADVMETLPRIINNLTVVGHPTGFEAWMIIKADTHEIIGDAGFKGFNQEQESADLGYGIIKEERLKGYATEAASALIHWAFSHPQVKEITASCLASNADSVKLLKKLNFTSVKQEDDMIHWYLRR